MMMFQEEEVESSVTSEEDEAADIEDEELRECEYKISLNLTLTMSVYHILLLHSYVLVVKGVFLIS